MAHGYARRIFVSDTDPLRFVQPAATRVRDPLSGRSIWLAGMVQQVNRVGNTVRMQLAFTPEHGAADRASIREALVANLRGEGLEGELHIEVVERRAPPSAPAPPPKDPVPGMSGPGMAPHGGPIRKKPLEGVKHVIAVASGKGGVGKSTVACNLAVGLQLEGYQVGLLDADIYGPSVPIMMNVYGRPLADEQRRLLPVMSYGVRCLSMGMLVDSNEAMIWRGPMVMGVVRQLLQEARWEGVDVLIIDLPPGTGDAQLTLIQAVDLSGAVIVTTPQEVALADAVRGIQMFRKLDVPLLGVVQNMAYYLLPDGTKDYVFGQDGGRRVAERYGTDVLAELPLRSAIRQGGDSGLPAVLGKDAVAEELRSLARAVAARLGLE
jgi:ATP-binding protein involved in chromosome partitioning